MARALGRSVVSESETTLLPSARANIDNTETQEKLERKIAKNSKRTDFVKKKAALFQHIESQMQARIDKIIRMEEQINEAYFTPLPQPQGIDTAHSRHERTPTERRAIFRLIRVRPASEETRGLTQV